MDNFKQKSFLQNKATKHVSPETRDLNPLSVVSLDMPVLSKPLFLQEARNIRNVSRETIGRKWPSVIFKNLNIRLLNQKPGIL